VEIPPDLLGTVGWRHSDNFHKSCGILTQNKSFIYTCKAKTSFVNYMYISKSDNVYCL